MFVPIITTVAPIITIIALGFLWAKLRMPFDNETIGGLVLRIGTPSLIFSTLTEAELALDAVGLIAVAAAAVIAICAVIGAAILRAARMPLHTYLLIAMHGNSGNMGLPLAAMVFGAKGLAIGVVYFLVVAISQHMLGLVISAGRFDIRSLARQPIVHVSLVTLAVLVSDVEVPAWIARSTEMLGGFVIPIMLLLLGVSLANLKVSDLRIAGAMALMRIGAGAAAALAVIAAFGLNGPEAGVVFIMATMPAAVVNFLYAERFGRSPERIAGVIVVSTVGTIVVLPGIVWLALWLGGPGPIHG